LVSSLKDDSAKGTQELKTNPQSPEEIRISLVDLIHSINNNISQHLVYSLKDDRAKRNTGTEN